MAILIHAVPVLVAPSWLSALCYMACGALLFMVARDWRQS